jgi:hypothetical protein
MPDFKVEVEQVRDYLRDPHNSISSSDSVSKHQESLKNIWEKSLDVAKGNPGDALSIAKDAVRSTQQPGETKQEYTDRLNGIPSHAFGEGQFRGDSVEGVDKPQHFFGTAELAFNSSFTTDPETKMQTASPIAGEVIGQLAGRAYEIKDWVTDLFLSQAKHGGFDWGDVVADDAGAKFGSYLATSAGSPEETIKSSDVNLRDYLPNSESNSLEGEEIHPNAEGSTEPGQEQCVQPPPPESAEGAEGAPGYDPYKDKPPSEPSQEGTPSLDTNAEPGQEQCVPGQPEPPSKPQQAEPGQEQCVPGQPEPSSEPQQSIAPDAGQSQPNTSAESSQEQCVLTSDSSSDFQGFGGSSNGSEPSTEGVNRDSDFRGMESNQTNSSDTSEPSEPVCAQ